MHAQTRIFAAPLCALLTDLSRNCVGMCASWPFLAEIPFCFNGKHHRDPSYELRFLFQQAAARGSTIRVNGCLYALDCAVSAACQSDGGCAQASISQAGPLQAEQG